MSDLELTNIINISVSAAQAGIGAYNTSNLALFTADVAEESFGDLGYKIYLSPSEVITDFGSDSNTAKMANAVFSQKPNILAGGGYLVVILLTPTHPGVNEIQKITFSSVPTAGHWKIRSGSDLTGQLNFNSNAAAIQSALEGVLGLGYVTVTGDYTAGFTITFIGATGPQTLLTSDSNSLQNTSGYDVTYASTVLTPGVAPGTTEALDAAITRTKDLVQYFGVLATAIQSQGDTLAAAAVIQALNKILFCPQKTQASVESGGTLDLLRTGDFTQSRGLLYIGAAVDIDTLVMGASYAGRALSTDFTGSNTTETMHLKDLAGVQPDSAMTQTILALAQTAGADVYASFQGVPKTFTSGENSFFDQVYNLQWFVGALQVAGFNALATTSTKVPQTESGVSVLSGAYRQVCEQAVTNQYSAPGTWNNATTFGNQGDFFRNISERGYYIYSGPVSQQSPSARAARQAPLIQIALKEAGAIHSSDVIVFVNA